MARANPSLEYNPPRTPVYGSSGYKPFEILDFDTIDFGSAYESINTEISEWVTAGITGEDVLATLAGLVDFGIGWIESQAEMDAARAELENLINNLNDQLQTAKERGEMVGEHYQEDYERAVRFAEENFGLARKEIEQMFAEAIDKNVAAEAETRQQTTQKVLSTALQGSVSQGKQAATAAQSGVRRSGSALGLLTENTRMFNVDLEEIDRQLEVRLDEYKRDRDWQRGQRDFSMKRAQTGFDQAIEGFRSDFTQGLEEFTGGRELDFTGFFAGEESFIDAMGGANWFNNTILTTPIKSALTGAQTSQMNLEEQWDSSVYGGVEEGFGWIVENIAAPIWDLFF